MRHATAINITDGNGKRGFLPGPFECPCWEGNNLGLWVGESQQTSDERRPMSAHG